MAKYREYFDIDPEYFPQVNKDIIESQPDLWKKFYPHETFVRLVKDTISILSRKQKVSLWVEGAYGTGKSHAVLTLKKLLEASEEDTKQYFEKFQDQLSNDLFNSFQQIKSGEQKILTVHRYGSSDIYGDSDLVFAIQESISRTLAENGYQGGTSALRESTIAWLSQDWAKNAFNELVKTEYTDLFDGDDVDTIIANLKEYSDEALKELMSKIMRVGKEKHFSALTMDVDKLVEWIKEVIKENNLKAITFIWDEFTEYFRNNMRALTGFQKIVDMSGNDPFYMIIVTHNVTHIFPDTDKDWQKIMGRFVQPICNIELPENMAFRLMGKAMEETKDEVVRKEWHETRDALYSRTDESRQLVKAKAGISDDELKKILPIHPYAALLLKHISSAFDSNQRSMFDFIKNDRGDEIKGFQWFIDENDPYESDNPLLTIDMLWEFFYEKGKEFLSHDIKTILDCFNLARSKNLNKDEQRVFKTILLLQAISQKTGNSVELFIPNERNLNNAFEGSDLENDEAVKIANRLIPDILFKKPLPGGKTQYSAMINTTNIAELEKEKAKLKQKTTSQLIQEANMSSAFSFDGALRLRYDLHYVSKNDFKSTINTLRAKDADAGNKIVGVITFAKDDAESVEIGRLIKDAVADDTYRMIFIDASINPLGTDLFEQYVDAMANSVINLKSDRGLAAQYETNAKDFLKKWKGKVADGEFIVYSTNKTAGERANNIDLLKTVLESINRAKYPEGLEFIGSVNETMWQSNMLGMGVDCGSKESVSRQYRSSNDKTKLENYIGAAWQDKEYWKNSPYLPISKIKIELNKLIDTTCERDGQISIAQIYDFLQDRDGKYGFMPCNLTAFVLGFLLKDYTDGTYNWSDGIRNEPLTKEKLKEMVSEIIKHQTTAISRYKDKFIGFIKPEEKAFNEASSEIFGIDKSLCVSAEITRDRIRQKMKDWSFPMWVLKFVPIEGAFKTPKGKIDELIDSFCQIANNGNYGGVKSDKEIAISIGQLCIDNPDIVADMILIATPEKIVEGMEKYLQTYEDSLLPKLASEVGDNGQYINRLKEKFKVDAANWVWNTETANKKISEVILEYKIVIESNKILTKNIAFIPTIHDWCDRCNSIRVSYLYAKNYWEELSDFMDLLYQIKKAGNILDSQKEAFLEQLVLNGSKFNDFYNNQTEMFKKSCSFLLGRFGDEEVKEIFRLLSGNIFTAEKQDYQRSVEKAIEKYVSEQGAEKLRTFWKDKTGFETPKAWSKEYKTPILCMVDDKDVQVARSAFATLNRKQPDASAVDKAMEFLETANFFDRLTNKTMIDAAFRNSIVKSYSVMLDDLDEVRSHLSSVMAVSVDDWFGLPEVDKKLRELAEYKYNQSGCDKALEKIDDMDVADVKQYLKKLIRDNMIVGMEIIKGK